MHNYTFTDHEGTEWKRVCSLVAEKAFNRGDDVILVPVKMNPTSVWSIAVHANKNVWAYSCPWLKVIDEYSYYNCNSELGTYPAYYVKVVSND